MKIRRTAQASLAVRIGLVLGFLVSALFVWAVASHAQDVPRWQHSIFTPVATVEKQPDGLYHFVAFTGAGYQTSWTVYDKGNVNVIGIGLTHLVNMTSAEDLFSYTVGLNLNFGGNFGVGAGYDMVNTGSQTGLALGTSSWANNGKLYFSFHLPLNGGGLINAWKE